MPGLGQLGTRRRGLTRFYPRCFPPGGAQFAEALPLKTLATQESMADAVVWLLEAADHVTGETLKIDAGMHLLGFRPT